MSGQPSPLSLARDNRSRIRASWISFVVGSLLLALKFIAYDRTKSQAILSDALESIANVVAALVGVIVVRIAQEPADRNHPYGHGKAEYFSATFEGGLITCAAVVIILQVIQSIAHGSEIHDLDFGLVLAFGAGLANALLGIFLIRVGNKSRSPTLIASGHHVISDFWTTFGVTLGLLIVKFTHWQWADPMIAIIVSLQLAYTGLKLVLKSVNVLMDGEDKTVMEQLQRLFAEKAFPGMIRVYHVRVIQAGRHHHVDASVVVPEFWDVQTSHDQTDRFASSIFATSELDGDIAFHVDPCRRAYCRNCDYEPCPIRRQPFENRLTLNLEELTSTIEFQPGYHEFPQES